MEDNRKKKSFFCVCLQEYLRILVYVKWSVPGVRPSSLPCELEILKNLSMYHDTSVDQSLTMSPNI